MLSKLNSSIKEATVLLEGYQLDRAPILVEKLFLDLSRVYIKYTRERSEDPEMYAVLYESLINILKMFLSFLVLMVLILKEHNLMEILLLQIQL